MDSTDDRTEFPVFPKSFYMVHMYCGGSYRGETADITESDTELLDYRNRRMSFRLSTVFQ